MVEDLFGQVALACHPVHDLKVLRVPGDGPQQPVTPLERLFLEAVRHHRLEGQGRITQPAEPVVPVARAAEFLRQGSGRSSNDAARVLVREGAKDQQGPQYGGTVLTAVVVARSPGLPVGDGLVERLVDVEGAG